MSKRPTYLTDDERLRGLDLSGDFEKVFEVELDGWASRTALYRVAVGAAESTGSRVPSPQQVYAALRARGFAEAKRRGVWGFRHLRVGEHAEAGRLVPAGTAAAYYRRAERTDEARESVFNARLRRRLAADSGGALAPKLSPWLESPISPEARERLGQLGRRSPRTRR